MTAGSCPGENSRDRWACLQRHRGTYDDRSHPLFEDEWGIDLLEKTEEEAVRLRFLTFWQLHTAKDIEAIPLLNTADNTSFDKRNKVCN